jgi:putative spermidine/putrescine transport system substrate-binding protein
MDFCAPEPDAKSAMVGPLGLSRRRVLRGLGGVMLGAGVGVGLGGCGRGAAGLGLEVSALAGTVPPQLPGQFQRRGGEAVRVRPVMQLEGLFRELEQGGPGAKAGALTMVGDGWLAAAIARGLVGPLDVAGRPGWRSLGERWRRLVWRDRSGRLVPLGESSGQVWGAPYRWGTTVLVYRRDRLERMGGPLADWQDLWRPQLARRVALLDQPREVLGAIAKGLGGSYNAADPAAIAGFSDRLRTLRSQVLSYGDRDYLQPLLLGDAWVAMGWSHEVLPALERHRSLGALVPVGGTALWADLWVRPAGAAESAAALDWIEFGWDGSVSRQLAEVGAGLALQDLEGGADLPPETTATRRSLRPTAATLAQSEFLEPLDRAARDRYGNLWADLRA